MMASQMKIVLFAVTIALMCSSSSFAQQASRMLFDFSGASAASQWQIVNDGVMGGRSSSRAQMIGNGQMVFSGNLSLENNGGFASVRTQPRLLGLQPGGSILLRVRGDGRKYTFNLYVPNRRTAFSYRMDFRTTAGQWTEFRLPINGFVATSFGRRVNVALDPRQVTSVGIMLADKKPGAFQITLDWIQASP